MDEISKACTKVLKTVFGYDSFRPLQEDIIKSVLQGKDTLAIMPTGGGKSVCYQIPALIFKGITIVVSPLISLMQDQVTGLTENGVDAAFLNSTLDLSEYRETVRKIKAGETKIVYVSPEALATERVKSILHEVECGVSLITIDEAHCISSWGHDFRPNYLEISSFRNQFPKAVCLALTATATKQVREDIVKQLGMKNHSTFIASFNRKNIFLEVRPKRDAVNQVISYLSERKEESGIIYCFSRKQVDNLTETLQSRGFSVRGYHAGLSDAVRAENQDLFIKDKVRLIVATVAFGMGINKPNVRFVIHFDIPKSVEEYYQEIGRAGRDGLPSEALLLYSAADIHKIKFFFESSSTPEKDEMLLSHMIHYATGKTCRRKLLLNYFGENLSKEDEEELDEKYCCDVCRRGPLPENNVTIQAQKFLSCIYRAKERFGAAYIIDVLLGSKSKRIIENGHTSLSTYGIGKELTKQEWFDISQALLDEGYIEKYGDYNILKVLPKGREALVQRKEISLPVIVQKAKVLNQVEPKKKKSAVALSKENFLRGRSESDVRLYETIREWRRKTAEEQNVPPYIIFGDKTIEDLVEKKPQNMASLRWVFGIGEAKAERIGSALLRLITEFE